MKGCYKTESPILFFSVFFVSKGNLLDFYSTLPFYIFILNIGTPYLLTIFVLYLEENKNPFYTFYSALIFELKFESPFNYSETSLQ